MTGDRLEQYFAGRPDCPFWCERSTRVGHAFDYEDPESDRPWLRTHRRGLVVSGDLTIVMEQQEWAAAPDVPGIVPDPVSIVLYTPNHDYEFGSEPGTVAVVLRHLATELTDAAKVLDSIGELA